VARAGVRSIGLCRSPWARRFYAPDSRKLTRAQAEEIARTKTPDLTAADLDAAVRTIAGSARSMGITVEGVK